MAIVEFDDRKEQLRSKVRSIRVSYSFRTEEVVALRKEKIKCGGVIGAVEKSGVKIPAPIQIVRSLESSTYSDSMGTTDDRLRSNSMVFMH